MRELSVIAVADYAAGEEKSWEDMRRALRAWADQEGGPAEDFTLVESTRFKGRIPDDVLGLVPNMKVLYFDSESAYDLKNRAVGVTDSKWVVLADADCAPERSWLRPRAGRG